MIWMERRSARSRYGRVRLDMFTTRHSLTQSGRAALLALSEKLGLQAPAVSPHDACWDRVPVGKLEELARSVLRAVNRPGNSEWDLPLPASNHSTPGRVVPFQDRATA